MKNRIILILSSIILQIASIIGGIIITRSYTKSELGTYQQGVLLFSVLTIIASFGAPKAIYYFEGTNKNLKQILLHILLLMLASCIIFSCILIFSWNFICNLFSNQQLHYLLVYIIVIFSLKTINELLRPISVLTKKVIFVSHIIIWTSLLQIISLSIMCYYQLPLHYIYLTHLCVILINTSFVIYLIRKHVRGKWEGLDKQLIISICKYSFPLLLSIITLIFARRIDGFIISSFSDPETMAIYSRGALEIPISGIVIYNIAHLLMPLFVKYFKEKQYQKMIETLNEEIKRISVLIIPVFFTFLLISKDMIVFLYTKEYIESIPVFVIYLFILPFQLYAFDTVLQAMNKTSFVFYISIVSAISNVIISIILFFMIGISGPAIGTVFSIAITNLLCLFFINKFLSNKFQNWLPWTFLFKIIIICSTLLLMFYLLSFTISKINIFIRMSLISSVFFIFQIGFLWKLNMITDKDKKMIKEKFKFFNF